ncbi:MAG TPA: dihydropteroate synthase [Gemmataceae bacterium]|nr:dihydropteroate synthase [Gemmataceae bacterium]
MSDGRDEWRLRDRMLNPGRTALVMGIINVTPDSFSDGGRFAATEAAVIHGIDLVRQGADLLDIGGESTRPGADPIDVEEELRRVLPVVRELAAQTSVPLSVDTCKAETARQALAAGAHVINDVTALLGDADMAGVVRDTGAGVILMHMQGTPRTMQVNPVYEDVTKEVTAFLEARLQAAEDVGIARSQVVLDPGVGFGKTFEHNLELLARLAELQRLGRPVCLGVSRKGFLGKLLDRSVAERMVSSVAAVCHALAHGAAQIVRVHDVAQTRDAVRLLQALKERERRL